MTHAEKEWLRRRADDERTAASLRVVLRSGRAERAACPHEPLAIDGLRLWLNPHNPYASLETYVEVFHHRAHSVVRGFPSRADRLVVDIGGNEGYYTLFVKRRCPEAAVIVVEPDPVAFAVLTRNIRGNRLRNVVTVNKAIAARPGSVPFVSVPAAPMLSGTAMRQARWMARPGTVRHIDVEALTLDDVFERWTPARVDLLKIDAEGAEGAILRSARSLARCRRMVVEYHGRRAYREVREAAGDLFDVLKDQHEEEGEPCGDVYFRRRAARRRVTARLTA